MAVSEDLTAVVAGLRVRTDVFEGPLDLLLPLAQLRQLDLHLRRPGGPHRARPRGVRTPGVGMVTSRLMGCFLDDERSRKEVLSLMGY